MRGDSLTTLAPVMLVAILAGLTFWLDNVAQLSPPTRGGSRHDPDYIVDRFSAVRMSQAGVAQYTLSAARMLHYPDDDSTLLTDPVFVSYAEGRAPLTITAEQAVVSSKGEHVYFQHRVRVTRAAHGDASEMLVETPFLHVIPDDGIAKTDRAVTITDAATRVTAVGMEMNNETREIRLLSDVRGRYDPLLAPKSGRIR
jgi:lipopolysaccharide export system protein LptC